MMAVASATYFDVEVPKHTDPPHPRGSNTSLPTTTRICCFALRFQETATYLSVVNETLWARLDDPRTVVRRAMYVLISACCRHAPGLLRPLPPSSPAAPSRPAETEEVAAAETEPPPGAGNNEKGKRRKGEGMASGKRSRVAVPILLGGLLSEKEDSNHREAWQAVLLVLREFKQTWMEEKGAAVRGSVVLPC